MKIMTNDKLDEIITVAMNKGNVNGIIAATYFVKNMYKTYPNITVPELIEGLTELQLSMEFSNKYEKEVLSDA